MPLPKNAQKLVTQLDPNDIQKYAAQFGVQVASNEPVLDNGETIASFTIQVAAESALFGLVIEQGSRLPALTNDAKSVVFWVSIDPAMRSNSAFNGDGVLLGVEITLITSSVPYRQIQRTAVVQVAQQ